MVATPAYVKMLFNEGMSITRISSKLKISPMTVCELLATPD